MQENPESPLPATRHLPDNNPAIMGDLVAQLAATARFYRSEAAEMRKDESRRDRRQLGWREADTIAELLEAACDMLKNDYRA